MHCLCGSPKLLTKGLCATCYKLKGQDEKYFGGPREEVLKRDGYCCRLPRCITLERVSDRWPFITESRATAIRQRCLRSA